jgi:transcriptional regulator with XRE-family HTH domain
MLRHWRERRSLSQLALSTRAAVSTRHLSFIETGRARPSREMLLHLAQRLDIPLPERNRLLLAAGFAPAYSDRSLDEPAMAAIREAIDRFLAAHEPYPALVIDRSWNIITANQALHLLTDRVAPELLAPPANAVRVTLHPSGMAPRIANLREWSSRLLLRLKREIALTGDPMLEALYREVSAYPGVEGDDELVDADGADAVSLPLSLRYGSSELRLINTITSFGSPLDVTLAGLTIEAFYPADRETAESLTSLASNRS